MTKEFEFEDAGRTFTCMVEAPLHAGMPPWWWFRVDTGGTTRYAPFEASANDTESSVRRRILACYAELLAIEARPVRQRPAWQKPVRPDAPAVAAPDQPPAPQSAPAQQPA